MSINILLIFAMHDLNGESFFSAKFSWNIIIVIDLVRVIFPLTTIYESQ